MQGYQLMERNQISGIAVTTASGELFSNLSASDLVHSIGSSTKITPEGLGNGNAIENFSDSRLFCQICSSQYTCF